MEHFPLESRHTKFHVGHTLMVLGIMAFFLVSLLLSAATTLHAAAFGAGTIANISNQARIDNGLESYSTNSSLSAAAQAKANHMVANGYFDHTAPDGTTGWYFVGQQGYQYTAVGENLAASNEDDLAVVNGWLNSPGHRANLLNNTFTEVGYGIAYKGDFQGYPNVTFIVALYASPQAPSPPPTPPPVSTTTQQTPPADTEAPTSTPVAEEPPSPTPTETPASQEDPSPVIDDAPLATEQTLSNDGFRINQNILIAALAVAGTFFGVGLGIESLRLYRHFVRARAHHTHHHA